MSRRIVGSRVTSSTRSLGRSSPRGAGGVAARASCRSSATGLNGSMRKISGDEAHPAKLNADATSKLREKFACMPGTLTRATDGMNDTRAGEIAMTIEGNAWPSLPLEKWEGTYETLRLWFQIVGKIRLSQTPWINHS